MKEKDFWTTVDKYMDLIFKILLLVLVLTLVVISISFVPNLDSTQKVFSVIGSLSLGVAVLTYLYKKKQI